MGTGAQVANELWFCLNIKNSGWKIILEPNAMVDHYPAAKDDYDRVEFQKIKCEQTTFNTVATEVAYLSLGRKLLYFLHSILVGNRTCPGAYFLLHSLVKRPRSVVNQMIGGWRGFYKGWQMSKKFKMQPPGKPNSPDFF